MSVHDVKVSHFATAVRDLALVLGFYSNTPLRDDVAEKVDRRAYELALGCLGEELVVAQRLEHYPHVREVLLARLGGDEDMVAVDSDMDEAPKHGRGRTCRLGRSRRGGQAA
jgi:hypothetical protein